MSAHCSVINGTIKLVDTLPHLLSKPTVSCSGPGLGLVIAPTQVPALLPRQPIGGRRVYPFNRSPSSQDRKPEDGGAQTATANSPSQAHQRHEVLALHQWGDKTDLSEPIPRTTDLRCPANKVTLGTQRPSVIAIKVFSRRHRVTLLASLLLESN